MDFDSIAAFVAKPQELTFNMLFWSLKSTTYINILKYEQIIVFLGSMEVHLVSHDDLMHND